VLKEGGTVLHLHEIFGRPTQGSYPGSIPGSA
jgi:hypothetical protein